VRSEFRTRSKHCGRGYLEAAEPILMSCEFGLEKGERMRIRKRIQGERNFEGIPSRRKEK